MPLRRLEGKVALVSGGAGGIGAAIVRRLVSEGARVVVGDILISEGEALATELGDTVLFHPLDVRDADQWQQVIEMAEGQFGPLSTLVCAAGRIHVASFEQTTAADFDRMYEVNVKGVYLGLHAALGSLKRNGGGSVVVFSSGAGAEGTPYLSAYAASKAANANLAQTAAIELAPYRIKVNAIMPGGVDTPMAQVAIAAGFDAEASFRAIPIPRIGVPDDIAPLVAYLVADENSYMTGQVLHVDGGLSAGRGHV
jgi:3alpha(or 20beta)-hydroxysteroid dehydrogenase